MSIKNVLLATTGLAAASLALAPLAVASTEEHAEHAGTPWLAMFVNLAIFFGVIGYFVIPKLKLMLTERSQEILDQLSAAERAREEAEARLAEMDEKLSAVGGQVEEILAMAKQHATAEGERILAQAEAEAAKVLEQAEAQVGDLQSQAERRLRKTAADLSVDLARDLLAKNLGTEDRTRLFSDYLKGLRKVAS